MNFFRSISSFDNCKNPLKVIGMVVGSALAFFGIKAACDSSKNWVDVKVQTKAAKEVEDYKSEKAQENETYKAEEERATKVAQAQAQAEAYERMRKADAELYREKKAIDLEYRQKYQDLSQQAAQEQVSESPSFDSAPNLRSTADVFNRPCGFGQKDWIVDGYAKPGQITMFVAGADVGKSSLLTQTALDVAKGVRPEYLPSSCCASLKLDVVYYRIEDFPDELKGKYGAGKVLKEANLKWVLPEDLGVISLTAFLAHVKHLASTLEHDTLVCADPVTKLDGYRHEECIKGLEEAQKIAKENGVTLTVIVAAHLDEINDSKHLTTEFIKGGDKGVQQAGAVIALRMEGTTGGDHRFIQCLKAPKGHPMPFPEGVLVCKYVKTQLDEDNSYLHFEYVEIKPEADARPEKPKKPKASKKTDKKGDAKADEVPQKKGKQKVTDEDKAEIAKLYELKIMKSAEIAKRYEISLRTVQRIVKEAQEARA